MELHFRGQSLARSEQPIRPARWLAVAVWLGTLCGGGGACGPEGGTESHGDDASIGGGSTGEQEEAGDADGKDGKDDSPSDAPQDAPPQPKDDAASDNARSEDEVACSAPTAQEAADLLDGQFAPPADAPVVEADTIAYVNYDNSLRGRTQLRLIRADGTDDRLLLEIPDTVGTWYRLWGPSFRPDGRELAFTSGHLDSFAARDIYAITLDGSNLRRITNPPLPDALSAYPVGTVTVDVHTGEADSAEYDMYMQGQLRPVRWLDPGRFQTWTVRMTVADLGDGVEQQPVLRKVSTGGAEQPFCAYNVPGTLTDVKSCALNPVPARLPPLDWSLDAQQCIYADVPLWRPDGRELLYIIPKNGYGANYRLASIATEDETPGTMGTIVNRDNPYLAVPPHELRFIGRDPIDGKTLLVAVAPSAATSASQLFRIAADEPRNSVDITAAICPDRMALLGGCILGGLAFRADGHGIYYVLRQSETSWLLRTYDFDTGEIEDLTELAHQQVHSLSVAPDGQRFLISVEGESTVSRDLWMYDRQEDAETLFLKGAASATWAPALPPSSG